MQSVMTSVMKPVLPLIFFAQFMYLYRCDLQSTSFVSSSLSAAAAAATDVAACV